MDKLIIEVRKKHTKLFIGLLSYILISTAAITLLFISNLSTEKKLSLLLVVFIIMLVLAFWFKPRFYYYSQQIKYLKLKKFQSPAIPIKNFSLNQSFINKLTKDAYQVFIENDNYLMLHRYTQDPDEYVIKRPMLEILVFIKDVTISYQSDHISHMINLIEEDYEKKKIKYTNYSIIEIKYSKGIDESSIKEINQVTFDIEGGRHISVINVYINQVQNEAHFLHSDLFTPNMYYNYAINIIKEILK